MKYKFFTNSERAWLAMLEDIKSAKNSIYLESFVLTDDEITHHFFETLKQKAQNGVRVKIIIDKIGDFWDGVIDREEFKKAGAEILFFNRWLYGSHRKILIVDGEIAYIGGVNIGGQYRSWLDLHVRLTGALVKSFLKSFSRVYALAGGDDPVVLGLGKSRNISKARKTLYKMKSWFIDHWPLKGKSALRAYYKKKLREAKRKIVIVTPYFIPHRWLIRGINSASHRGVKIEVILPKETDIGFYDIAHRVFAGNLKDTIDFFFIPEMNHAKVLLVDDHEGLVGSNNIDARSFDFNLEASVIFQRKDMIGNLKNILERWKRMAIPATRIDNYHKWYHKILGIFISLFQPIL